MNECIQTNIPVVDETEPNCSAFISAECIVFEEAINTLGLNRDSNMKQVLDALLHQLATLRVKVEELENQLIVTENE